MKVKRWVYKLVVKGKESEAIVGTVVTSVDGDEEIARGKVVYRHFGRKPIDQEDIAIELAVARTEDL